MTAAVPRLERISGSDEAACDAAVAVIQGGFLAEESCCRACGVSGSPDAVAQLSRLARVALQDGVSVGLYRGDRMVAVCINKILVPPPDGEPSFMERFRDEHVPDPHAAFFMNFMVDVETRVDMFGLLGADKPRVLFEHLLLGVLPTHRRLGYAHQVVRKSVQVARDIGAPATCAIFTSEYSQAIGKELGFKELVVAEHSEFIFEGTPINQRLPPHQQRSKLDMLML